MFCLGLILYEMLLPPFKTYSEKDVVFANARVGKLDTSVKGSIYEKLILQCLEVCAVNALHCSTTYNIDYRTTQLETLMMNNGDIAVPKESLDMILSYINRAEVRVRRCAHE